MGEADLRRWISPDEYLAGEKDAEIRHEYVNGHVFAMSDAGRTHNRIVRRLVEALGPAADGCGCHLYFSDVKLRVEAANAYYYPDLIFTCEKSQDDSHVVYAPALVVEVASPGAETVDRREKLAAYLTIPWLREYVIIAQETRRVDVWRRTADGWRCEACDDGAVRLDSADCEIPLDEIYA